MCEKYWICDECSLKWPTEVDWKECPRCERMSCNECDYLGWCAQCGKTTLCNDCAEEDWIPFAPVWSKATSEPLSTKGVNLLVACQSDYYLAKFCGGCGYRRQCKECQAVFCDACIDGYTMEWRQCEECDSTFCDSCMDMESAICIDCELGE